MRLALFPGSVLATVMLALPASATISTFTVSGLDDLQHPYSYAFSLETPNYTYPAVALYSGVTIFGSGGSTTAELNLVEAYKGTDIDIEDPFLQILELNWDGDTSLFTTDPASGNALVITPGTYTGINLSSCPMTSSLERPHAFQSLAMLDLTTPLAPCASAVMVQVTNSASSLAPEPSALALLGTGALGVLGVVRRRFRR